MRVYQAARIITGVCPDCGTPITVLNDYETWPLVECRCGWRGGITELYVRARFERGSVSL